MSRQLSDLTGQTINMLTVVRYCGKYPDGKNMWECICKCGKTKLLSSIVLTAGKVQSCGCLVKKNARKHWGIPDDY